MLWGKGDRYEEEPFEVEADLETAIEEVAGPLFGKARIYLPTKKKVGKKGSIRNIPDGYLLDLASAREPRLFVVENELAKHDPLKHVAVQILEFCLSFETAPHLVKRVVRDALAAVPEAWDQCQAYAQANGFENVDVLP